MEQFDHHSEEFAQNWPETYAELRRTCPVAHSDRHDGFYVVTRHDDVRAVLHDPATYACSRDLVFDGRSTGGVTVPVNPVRMGMMEMDPPESQGFRRIQVTRAEHPYAGAWWPDGHTIGYEHTFTHEVRDLLEAIAAGRDPVPSFADGLHVQLVLDAVQHSAAAGSTWQEVAP